MIGDDGDDDYGKKATTTKKEVKEPDERPAPSSVDGEHEAKKHDQDDR